MIAETESLAGKSQDFARFVDLQQQHSHLRNQLDELEVVINRNAQAAATSRAEDYVILQEAIAKLDTEIKSLFEQHPEWRGEKKSVATPYGEVAQRSVTELDVPNPAMTVALIEAQGTVEPAFKAAKFLRVEKSPNLEALEALGDDALAKLGVRRVKREVVTVKPPKVNVAKAVKAAQKK